MHIVYYASYYKPAYVYGGPVRCTADLLETLVDLGAEVTVLTTDANGRGRLQVPLKKPVDIEGVSVSYFPRSFNEIGHSIALSCAFSDQISSFDIAILDSLWSLAFRSVARTCMCHGVPYVVPLHGQLLPWALQNGHWKKQLYLGLGGKNILNNAASLRCTIEAEAEAVKTLGIRAPLFVLPHGLKLSDFEHLPKRGWLRSRLGISQDAIVLLYLGRLHPIKRPDIAVSTLAFVQNTAAEVHLVIAGPDEAGMASHLRKQAWQLGCGHRLHFTGLLEWEQILEAFADADLMIMPSEVQENFGMSALEAAAAGLPAVVSEGVPVGKWIEHERAGRMISCTTTNFSETTYELLTNLEELREMGQRACRMVKREFDINVIARKMLNILEDLVVTRSP